MDPDILSKFQNERLSCSHAAQCPGCPLLDLAYSEQLTHKRELVRSALAPYAELAEVGVGDCAPAAQRHAYRTRAKWVAADGALGLYARGTHRALDLPGCQVVDPLIAQASQCLRALLPAAQYIEGADIARVGDRLLITLIVASAAAEHDVRTLATRLSAALPNFAGISYARRAKEAVQLLSGGHQLLAGVAELAQRDAPDEPYHYVAFGAFLQAHAETARAIYARLLEGALQSACALPAARPLRVLELYAGSGSLSLSLAARGLQVTAVESYAPACERMQRAAREQKLLLRVEQGDAEACVSTLAQANAGFDVVLVNPPRRGLTPKLRAAIAALCPGRVGYVSCRPATLARDLAHFARLGLRAVQAEPFDMIPQTEQVETLVWLQPGAKARVQVVASAPGWCAVIKQAHEPCQSVGSASLLDRVEQPAWCAARKLASDCSGLVLLAPEGAAPSVQRRVFLALLKGVIRARGQAQSLRYVREQVIAGHSLVRVEAEDDASLREVFRRFGHPVLGDARADRASAKYFWLRHGLDRPFLHLTELTLGAAEATVLHAPLPADLAAVLASLVEARSSAPEQNQTGRDAKDD